VPLGLSFTVFWELLGFEGGHCPVAVFKTSWRRLDI
jgi:hypothetical protein